MPRFFVRFAVVVLVAASLRAENRTTQCRESEIPLDGMHSAVRLEDCGEGEVSGSLLWHLDRIDQISSKLDGHIDRSNGGAGSVIYVMDTGVLASHAEFEGPGGSRVIAGIDAAGAVSIGASACASTDRSIAPCYATLDELDATSHGTAVASIAAGKNIGVAPDASVVSVRVMNERGLATTRTYLDGLNAIIRHAWRPGSSAPRTSVVNISAWVLERLNNQRSNADVPYAAVEQKMRDMIDGVAASGTPDPAGRRFLFVVAANNVDGGCGPQGTVDRFPATLGAAVAGMITVGGMTSENTEWSGSCRGGVEVLAPAQAILGATITAADHYREPRLRSGTSFATPIVSGIAARLLSERPDLTPQQVEAWITASPSRVWNPSAAMADGKVAYVRSIR